MKTAALILPTLLLVAGCVAPQPSPAKSKELRYETCIKAGGTYRFGGDTDWSCTLPEPKECDTP